MSKKPNHCENSEDGRRQALIEGLYDQAAAKPEDVALYRRRAALSLYEAACLAHGQDPERLANAANMASRDRLGREQPASIVAAHIENMAEILLGDVGETVGKLKKMNAAASMSAAFPVSALAECLADLGMVLPFGLKPEAKTATGPRWEEAGSWEQSARKIGEAWMNAEEKRTGARPGIEAIAKHVEGELSTLGITGKRGKFPDWETIKREALTGITGRKPKGKT